MAQRVINEIRTNFTETGAAKTAKATDTVGKAQTRLGQASASAGRQFSAQSQGLGGIVSAYAGAAANVFAITAAFFALRRAAEFEQIVSGTNALASTIGASGTQIVNSVQEITKSQLSLLDTVQQVNLALVSGFNTEQIEQLSDVSLRASKALGRNLGDAFARIVRGAAKLEPELLDELGIFTRIDPAVRKYADSIGVSVTSLTNFERRQAFVNAVIEEGLTKFRDVNVGTRTAAESLQTLAARVVDVGLKFGAALATGIAPFADFISDKGSNVLAAFGILARVIGAQALAVLDAGVAKTAASIANFGDRGALAVNNLSLAFKEAAVNAQQAASQVALTRFGTETEKSSKRAAVAILEEVAAGKVLTRSKTELAIATLNEAKAAEIAFQTRSKNDTNIKSATTSIKGLTVAINALNSQQKAGVVGANLFSSALTKLAGAARFAGAAVSKVFGFVTTAITALSIFQLVADGLLQVFGFDIVDTFEPIINFFKEFIDNLNMGKKLMFPLRNILIIS